MGATVLARGECDLPRINAAKRSVVLDLKGAAGRDTAHRLARRADVFVQNLRPGLAERLRLGFSDLTANNERLIYCSIGAFGRGPAASRARLRPADASRGRDHEHHGRARASTGPRWAFDRRPGNGPLERDRHPCRTAGP